MNEGSAKQQIVEGIRANANILVTVSDSPSVDELSAALGLTMLLNKIDKRATAIFSGKIPPAIMFLDPQKTFEGTVDSLRDFIIALDKEKADHLRYKLVDDVVKIFITPYRTTLTEKDLEFSQGDYNVEMVIAIGVQEQNHLDKALAAHGRILHDAAVATISLGQTPSKMGTIDWQEANASSFCEMLVSLTEALKDDQPLLDEQIASAFLTGIVSATDRFSNDRTSSRVMTMAAQLMAAGANQQLIAAKLQEAHDIGPNAVDKSTTATDAPQGQGSSKNQKSKNKKKRDDNSLTIERIDHEPKKKPTEEKKEAKEATDQSQSTEANAAAAAAFAQAEPAKDLEKELAEQLAEVAPSIPAPAAAPAELEKELNEALDTTTPPVETPAPELAAVPAPAPEPLGAPELPPLPPVDMGMPGFEALDVPAPAPTPAPEPAPETPTISTVSEAIDARPGNSYVESNEQAKFDAPVDSLIAGADGTPDQYVDPFSTPLAPMPEMREGKQVEPITQPQDMPPVNVAADIKPTDPIIEEVERAAMPPLPPTDLPPLPPLPDFSDNNLPPLPPPPPPPMFDQPMAAPGAPAAGPVASDALGDIFGSVPPQPEAPMQPQEPPKPGQFRIPGQ